MPGGRFLTAVLLGLLTASHDGLAAPGCGPYSVALYEYGALYYKGEDGKYRGIDKELTEELARRSGCKLDTVLESRVRIWAQLEAGKVAITTSALPTTAREAYAEFVPYLRSRQAILLRKELASTLHTPEDFLADRTRTLIVLRGSSYPPQMQVWIDALRAQQRLSESPDQPTALRIFKAGRADALLIGTTTLALVRKRDPVFASFMAQDWAPQDYAQGGLAMSLERVSAADRALLRRTLEAMLRDGSVDTILQRHLGDALLASVRHRPAVAEASR